MAVDESAELVVQALHEGHIERELKRPAAELLAASETGGVVEETVECFIGNERCGVDEGFEGEEGREEFLC